MASVVALAGCSSGGGAATGTAGKGGAAGGGTAGMSAAGSGGSGGTGAGGTGGTAGAAGAGGTAATAGSGGTAGAAGAGGTGGAGASAGAGGAGAVAGSGGASGGRGGAGGTGGASGTGGGAGGTGGALLPGTPTVQDFHLTARPWTPINFPRDRYLRNASSVAHAMVKYQDATGAIIDPLKMREWQYGTPFFIYAGAALIDTGYATDLMNATVLAMNHTSGQIAAAATASSPGSVIPNDHGAFFLAPLAEAYVLLKSHVPTATADTWKSNLATPIEKVGTLYDNNWRTYSMKGQWMRAVAGIVTTATAQEWLEYNWTGMSSGRSTIPSQLSHIGPATLQFYHDLEVVPETYAYDCVSRMNIESILESGYAGPSAATMKTFTTVGGENAVKTLDPTGQGAGSGRSSDHAWNDVVPGNGYERLANRYKAAGDAERAGRYRRAAMLALRGSDRWFRADGAYSVTKNQFDYPQQVHYADYSAPTNYNGSMMYHQAESYYEHQDGIDEWPTWTEIGGYALTTDDKFWGVFANAGGMMVQVALRGDTTTDHALYWTALGVARFSRVDWDSRLGPSDGIRDQTSNLGLSFAPTYMSNGSWTRLASIPDVYGASATVAFTHPLLVHFSLDYAPLSGQTGPTFHEDWVVTPDGALTTLTSSAAAGQFGVTWPLLSNDGAGALVTSAAQNIGSTRFSNGTDEQNFIAVGGGTATLAMDGTVRGGYGDLLSIRYVAPAQAATRTFVYPRNASAPTAAAVRDSFMMTATGFKSALGRVDGNTYVGATSAGGEARALDIDGDGAADVTFSASCKFVLQLANGRPTAVEADRAVTITVGTAAPISLAPYQPVRL